MYISVKTNSAEQTEQLGCDLGKRLRGGEIILLCSDVGGGKTTFVRGIVLGAESENPVSSPTFMISQIYKGVRFEVHHYDLYRLGEMGLTEQELKEVLTLPDVVTIIEWPDLADHALPKARIVEISFERDASGESIRNITIDFPESLSYLEGFNVKKAQR